MIAPSDRARLLARLSAPLLAAGLAVAGCGGGEAAPPAEDADVALVATEFAYEPSDPTAEAGAVTVSLDNQGEVPHNWLIEGREDEFELETEPDGQVVGTMDLPAGTYTFYCDIAGHREAGMEGTLTVE